LPQWLSTARTAALYAAVQAFASALNPSECSQGEGVPF
jgi:hypothetical protein